MIVAPTCDLMSSPMTGRPASAKRRCQYGSRPMKTGMALTNATPAWSACSAYHFVACSRADRQVADHDVDLALPEDADDVGRRPGRLGDDLGEVLAEAVVGHAALDGHAEVRHVGESVGVVRLGEDRLRQVLADLVAVDVEGGDELDVADVVAAEVDVHQARDEVAVLGIGVVVAALHQAAGAVADADDGDAHLAVAVRWPLPLWRPCRCCEPRCSTLLAGGCGRLAQAPDVEDALDDGHDRQDGEDDEDADEPDA